MEACMTLDSPSNTEDKLDQHIEDSSASNEDLVDSGDSSTSEDTDSEMSTLDLIEKSLSEAEDKDEEVDSDSDTEEAESEDSDKENTDDKDDKDSEKSDKDSENPTDEEIDSWKNDLKVKSRKRFEKLQSLYKEEKQLRTKAEEDAGQFRQFNDFLTNNNISAQESYDLFNIGALLKSGSVDALHQMAPHFSTIAEMHPQEALQQLKPLYDKLLHATGNVLDPNLRQQVKDGYVSEDVAYQLAQERARNQQLEANRQREIQQNQAFANQQDQLLKRNIESSLTNLESKWQSTDADYGLKSNRIRERLELKMHEARRNGTMPRSVDEAVKMMEDIKVGVDQEIAQLRPRKQSVNTVDSNASRVETRPQPKSTLDVINQSLGA